MWSPRDGIKPVVAHDLRALDAEIIEEQKSELGAMPTGKILGLKRMTREGLAPIDPGFLIAVVPYEGDADGRERKR
jgi:hypothetical protein